MIKKIKINSREFTFTYLQLEDLNNDYFNLLSQLSKINFNIINNERNLMFFQSLNYNHLIIIIKFNEKIIGSGTILIENKIIHSYKKVSHIEDIIIDKEFRGYGLGVELINLLVEISKNRNCYKCILDCHPNLIDFYNDCGFDFKNVQMAYYF